MPTSVHIALVSFVGPTERRAAHRGPASRCERPYVRLIRRIRPFRLTHRPRPTRYASVIFSTRAWKPDRCPCIQSKRGGAAACGGGGGSADSISGWNAGTGLPACSHADWSADS